VLFYAKQYDSDGSGSAQFPWPCSKIVCVGRNYVEHAKELNNPIPKSPLLFIKSTNTLVDLEQPIRIPNWGGECQHELEVAILIGTKLTSANMQQAIQSIVGMGLGIDLTFRDLQTQLKSKSHPWERAKSFDGACPISKFISIVQSIDLQNIQFSMTKNDEVVQFGETQDMIFSIGPLLAEISSQFTLYPGDIVLTGTPAGVGSLQSGDLLSFRLGETVMAETSVE
jgi:2-keto-4-pentenoate hydratase/2-oxohepta-3-ene-1,7-dioic acid hydratase in catechol pathway